jgi:hypothetical protein
MLQLFGDIMSPANNVIALESIFTLYLVFLSKPTESIRARHRDRRQTYDSTRLYEQSTWKDLDFAVVRNTDSVFGNYCKPLISLESDCNLR